jgi:hypothetical protein
MNLSRPLGLITLIVVSLLIPYSPAGAQDAPPGVNNKKAPAGEGRGQKKPDKCELSAKTVRNWDVIGNEYVFFDYVLCPPGLQPPAPLVRVWLTTKGDGFAIEKWGEGRDGADSVSVYRGKKRAFTLYRELGAVPLTIFKAERRSAVPADLAAQPFMQEGVNLIPLENLKPESAERVRKVFEGADVLVRAAQGRYALLHDVPKMEVIVTALAQPLKAQE